MLEDLPPELSDLTEPRLLQWTETALAGDEDVAVALPALHEDGLEKAVPLDRALQPLERLGVEMGARLLRVRGDRRDVELDDPRQIGREVEEAVAGEAVTHARSGALR